MMESQKYRCPDMRPDLWERITDGPERCMVELTFKNGKKIETYFFDGWCPENFKFEDVVDAQIIGGSL